MADHFSPLDPSALRRQFPALQQQINGQTPIFLDGPGGTQVPQAVIDAITGYLIHDNSNRGGPFRHSRRTDQLVDEARQAVADLFNAERPEELVFGQNMTTLTYGMSRALSRTWSRGDEIVLSRLDHNANIDPWLQAAADRGVTVRWLTVDPVDCTLRLDQLPELLNERTRLVALTYASNAVGSITDVARAVELAHAAGALIYVDAVHFAPHGRVDVQALDCDFLVSSPYKYYGPHMGVLYGKYALLDELEPYKLRPVHPEPPDKWETGTLSFENMCGVRAAVDYLAAIGRESDHEGRPQALQRAMDRIVQYEQNLTTRFLRGAAAIPGLRITGIADENRRAERTPTFAVRLNGRTPEALGDYLAAHGVFAWVGHFYALTLMETLDLLRDGGVVRLGFVHYNTAEEVDRVLNLLDEFRP